MVRHDERYTVDQALQDPFFNLNTGQNAQLQRDLEDLEGKVGQKWLTSYEQLNEDEERWCTKTILTSILHSLQCDHLLLTWLSFLLVFISFAHSSVSPALIFSILSHTLVSSSNLLFVVSDVKLVFAASSFFLPKSYIVPFSFSHFVIYSYI